MFYFKTGMTRRIRLHPKYIGGKNDTPKITKKLALQDLEEKCYFTPENGYIVSLTKVEIGPGYCLPSIGHVEYLVTYGAVVLFPVVGEVIMAEVVKVTDTNVLFRHVCMYGIVRASSLNFVDEYKYEEVDVEPGSDSINSKEGQFRSSLNSKVIKVGTVIRVKVVQRALGGNGFFLTGSMFDDYMGPVENPPPIPELKPRNTEADMPKCADFLKDVLPHNELQKLWKSAPYGNTTPDSSRASTPQPGCSKMFDTCLSP